MKIHIAKESKGSPWKVYCGIKPFIDPRQYNTRTKFNVFYRLAYDPTGFVVLNTSKDDYPEQLFCEICVNKGEPL